MFSLQIFLYFALEINIKLKRYKEDNFICCCFNDSMFNIL